MLQVGDPLPDVVLYEGDHEGKVRLLDFFSGKKGVLFGVVGAFTPTCSKSHLPAFVREVSARPICSSLALGNVGFDKPKEKE